MKKIIIKSFDSVIVLLLFVFGVFSGCIKPEYGMPVPEYGVPEPDKHMYVSPIEGQSIIKEDANQDAPIVNEMIAQNENAL